MMMLDRYKITNDSLIADWALDALGLFLWFPGTDWGPQLLDPLTPISPSHCHSSTSAPRCSIRGLATVRVQEKRVSGPPPSTLGCLSWSVGRPTATAERPWPKPDPLQRLRGPWVQELWSLKSGALDSVALDRGILDRPGLRGFA